MRHLRSLCLVLPMTVGGFQFAGCTTKSEGVLSEYVDVIVHRVDMAGEATSGTGTDIVISVWLVNRTADVIQVVFNSRKTQSAGGFVVATSSGAIIPPIKVSGTEQYDSMASGYGVLPGHGRRGFDLLLDLPESQARHVLANPQSIQVGLIAYGVVCRAGYLDLVEASSRVIARWDPSESTEW